MTASSKPYEGVVDRRARTLIDDTLNMSREQVRAEIVKLGLDPKSVATELRERVERGLRTLGRVVSAVVVAVSLANAISSEISSWFSMPRQDVAYAVDLNDPHGYDPGRGRTSYYTNTVPFVCSVSEQHNKEPTLPTALQSCPMISGQTTGVESRICCCE